MRASYGQPSTGFLLIFLIASRILRLCTGQDRSKLSDLIRRLLLFTVLFGQTDINNKRTIIYFKGNNQTWPSHDMGNRMVFS